MRDSATRVERDSVKGPARGSKLPTVFSISILVAVLLAALSLAAPGSAAAQQPDSGDAPPRARDTEAPPGIRDMEALVAQLDSGSRAFEAGRLQDARRHHLRAVELAPGLTSAWFGLFMVEDSLGNRAAADSALMRVRRISPGAIPPELQDRLPDPRP